MKLLLDVNVLVAACHTGHSGHDRARHWVAGLQNPEFLTSPVTEIGFVRVAVACALQPGVVSAISALERWKKAAKARMIGDDHGAARLPAWADTPGKTTDGHLVELAHAHGAKLATMDTKIPGALLLP